MSPNNVKPAMLKSVNDSEFIFPPLCDWYLWTKPTQHWKQIYGTRWLQIWIEVLCWM